MLHYKKFSKLKSITVLLVFSILAYSCDDLVDEFPVSEVAPENFYKTNNDMILALTGIYDAMQGAYNSSTLFWGELRSDNHQPSQLGSTNLTNLEVVNNDITQGNPQARWNTLYKLIERCNRLIVNAPNVAGLDDNILAEALVIRAKAYFDAVRVWGNVPLFLEPITVSEEAFRPVTDGTTIMNDVVIPDMERAQALMTNTFNKFQFSKSSVYCFQAEVYMWLNEHQKAKDALDDFFLLGGFSLVDTPLAWDDLFHNNPVGVFEGARGKIQEGPELILSIRYDENEVRDNPGVTRNNRSGLTIYFAGLPSYNLSDTLEKKWRDKFPVVDSLWKAKYPGFDPPLTKEVFYIDEFGVEKDSIAPIYGDFRYFYSREGRELNFDSFEIGEARAAKWHQVNYSSNDDVTDMVLYRYADMVLLLAEAENYLSSDGGRALELVNQVRTARQLPLVTALEFGNSPEDRLDYILDERQLELFAEGKRWWDLVRNNKAMEVLNPILQDRVGGVPLTQERLVWPIFVDHLIENPLLEQNIGYRN